MFSLNIKTKMIVNSVLVACVMGVVIFVGYRGMRSIDNCLETIYDDNLMMVVDMGNINNDIGRLRGDLYKYMAVVDQRSKTEKTIEESVANITADLGKYSALSGLSEKEKTLLASIEAGWKNYTAAITEFLGAMHRRGDEQKALAMLLDGGAVFNARKETEGPVQAFADLNVKDAAGEKKTSDDTFTRVITISLSVGIGGALLMLLVSLGLTFAITKPLGEVQDNAEQIAKGDLSRSDIKVTSNDEIGQLAGSINNMKHDLGGLLTKIRDAVNQIASASAEINAGSQQQSASVREQSAAINETSSAAKELSKSSESIGEKTKGVTQTANHSMVGMAKIKDTIGKTSERITSLGEKSQRIGKIIEMIDDIADKTNLLAVNASIEAARAGEQGRGFTVVADEIRKLSDSTAKSTKDITSLIEEIQHEISNAVIAMEQSVSSVDEEVVLAKETAENTKEISMTTTQQINASKQIAEAMDNINEAMKQVSSGTQQNQVASKQLSVLGDELKNEIAKFKIG